VPAIYKRCQGESAIKQHYRQLLDRWPVAHEESRVPTREGETFVIACGAREAPPLMLLHGSGTNSAMWMGDVGTWAAEFRVYAVDVIGEPGFSAPSRPPLGSEACALWLDDVLEVFGVEKASFVGVSLGGWLALDYAARRPEKVEQLALINPSGIGRQKPSFLLIALPLLLLGPWGRRKAFAFAAGRTTTPATQGEREMAAFVSLIFQHFRPRLGKVPVFDNQTLRRLTMPVLLILGARDALLDARESKRRAQALIPRLDMRYLADAGHVIRSESAAIAVFFEALLKAARGAADRARASRRLAAESG